MWMQATHRNAPQSTAQTALDTKSVMSIPIEFDHRNIHCLACLRKFHTDGVFHSGGLHRNREQIEYVLSKVAYTHHISTYQRMLFKESVQEDSQAHIWYQTGLFLCTTTGLPPTMKRMELLQL